MDNDMISRQAAIDAQEAYMADHPLDGYEDELALIDILRNLLSAQPEKRMETHACDLIDRQAAITEFSCCELTPDGGIDANYAIDFLKQLPSAQPERLTDYSFEESCTECPAYDTENHRCPRFNQVIRTVLKDANLEPCENCISRQAAIDALADMHCKSDEDGYVWIIRSDAWARIDALPSAQPEPQWIPVSERLPEKPYGCFVTVWDTNPATFDEFENILPYFVGWDGEQWNDADGEQCPFEVIAWMPLPEPYKGETQWHN